MIIGNTKAWILGKEFLSSTLPSGIILLWSGQISNIPSGWALCNGSNGTPDLRNRFIVGAGSTYTVGATGGSDTVTLTTAQMSSHNHTFSGSAASNGSHGHTATLNLSGLTTSSSGSHSHSLVKTNGFSYLPYYIGVGYEQNTIGGGSGSRLEYIYKNTYNNTDLTQMLSISAAGDHTHTVSGSGSVTVAAGGAHTHTVSGTVGSTGSGTAHENRPPYYALCYIMKL